jgi:IS5 family transposase
MRQADQVLEDDALLTLVQQEMAKNLKKSKTRGRPGTPAEVVLRMLLLKHVRDYSFQGLTRDVHANLVYREFARISCGKANPNNQSDSGECPDGRPRQAVRDQTPSEHL